jgi:hypothetical protein
MPWEVNLICLAVAILLIGGLTYYCLSKKYNVAPGYLEKLEKLERMIKDMRDQMERKNSFRANDNMHELLTDNRDLDLHKIMITVQNAHDKANPIKVLDEEQAKIDLINDKINKNRILKAGFTLVACVIAYLVSEKTVVAIIEFLFYSNADA